MLLWHRIHDSSSSGGYILNTAFSVLHTVQRVFVKKSYATCDSFLLAG